MAGLLGLALLGQVACSQLDMCQLTPDDPPAEDSQTSAPWLSDEPLQRRIYCIEFYESGHDGAAYNPRSGARGWLQYLPSTAQRWGVIIGDRWSEWRGAARIAERGEAFFASQWVPVRLGWC